MSDRASGRKFKGGAMIARSNRKRGSGEMVYAKPASSMPVGINKLVMQTEKKLGPFMFDDHTIIREED